MPHVPSPQLRRLADEPLAVPDRALRHLSGCGRCQAEADEIAADAALAARILGAPCDIGDVDLEWAMLQERLQEPGPAGSRAGGRLPRRLGRVSVSTGTIAAAAVVALGAGAAAALTTIYAPTHVAPVRVDQSDLQAVEDITGLGPSQLAAGLPPSGSRSLAFGQLTWTSAGRAQQVGSIARASALTHLAWSAPAALPHGVGAPGSVALAPQVTAAVSFSRSAGPGIAGSTLQITAGPAVVVQYGGTSANASPATMAIAVMQRPVASSSGATAGELEQFLLSRGGLPAGLAQEVRLLGNPATTLPVPVPPGMTQQQLTIGGTPAVLVTASSGVASAVIWESKDGTVHAVGGLLDKEDVLSVARQIG